MITLRLLSILQYRIMIFILQEVQQEINKMIEEAAIEESDEDEDADLSDNTVEGRIQCKSDMITLCGDLCTIVTSGGWYTGNLLLYWFVL